VLRGQVSAPEWIESTTDTGFSLDVVVYFKQLTPTANYHAFYEILQL